MGEITTKTSEKPGRDHDLLTLLMIMLIAACFLAYFFWLTDERSVKSYLTANSRAQQIAAAETSCKVSSDCQLVVSGSWTECGLENDCQSVDYAKAKWIAVNSLWYANLRNSNCTPDKYQPPACNPKPKNERYAARCISQECKKVAY